MPDASPQPPQEPQARPGQAGYVPAFAGADGQEDPAPEAVVSSVALPAAARPADAADDLNEADDDGRFGIAEEVATDLQTDAARRIGRLPPAVDPGGPARVPDPAAAVAAAASGGDLPGSPAPD